MQRTFVICLIICIAASCRNKHAGLSGEEKVDIEDFIAAFPKINLPYHVADTSMVKTADNSTISYTVFSEFIPDTVLINALGETVKKMRINPVGKIQKNDELYLL